MRARIDGPGADRWLAPDLAAAEELVAAGTVQDRGRGGRGGAGVKGSREVRAPRGTELSCKGWPQEAALRMLMNNLDPDVAEHPDDLVVYGGTGRAARSWEAYDAIVASLRDLEADETLLVQSGKPVGVMRTHEWAPRVLIANSNLVPEWATWDEFRRLEDLGLTMYGQMTAGSWIYIGTQGIVQGTYECFAEIARRHHGGSLAGTITLTAGLGGMGGAQPLAVTMNDGVVAVRRGRPAPHPAAPGDALPRRAGRRLDDAVARCRAAAAERRALSVGLLGNAAEVFTALLEAGFEADIVTDQTSAHDPLGGYVPGPHDAGGGRARCASRTPTSTSRRSRAAMAAHCAAMVGFQDRGAEVFDYGNSLRAEAKLGGFERAFDYPGFVPAYVRPLFCEGKGPFRWVALSGDPADIARDRPRRARGVPRRRAPRPLDPLGRASGSRSRACPPASAGSATASARGSGCASTRWCARASCRRRS